MEKPETDVDLPRALIRRIVKEKLTELAGDDSKDYSINKDALTALSESTKVFISLIASTANDICQEKRRQTVNADDIFTALQDLEFPELIAPLREQLEAFKEAVRERNKNRPSKKRKQNVFDQPLVIPRNPKQSQQGGLQGSELQPDEQGDLQGLDGEGEVELEGEAGGELEGGGDGDGDGDGELLLPGDGLSDGGDMPGMGMMMGDMGMGMGLINGQG